VELHFHSPNTPQWRGVQLKKSTGTTLPLAFHRVDQGWPLISEGPQRGREASQKKCLRSKIAN